MKCVIILQSQQATVNATNIQHWLGSRHRDMTASDNQQQLENKSGWILLGLVMLVTAALAT